MPLEISAIESTSWGSPQLGGIRNYSEVYQLEGFTANSAGTANWGGLLTKHDYEELRGRHTIKSLSVLSDALTGKLENFQKWGTKMHRTSAASSLVDFRSSSLAALDLSGDVGGIYSNLIVQFRSI